MKKKHPPAIFLLGGSFDPIHYAHLRILIEIHSLFPSCPIRVIPCRQPNYIHKNQLTANQRQRLEMLYMALDPLPFIEIDEQEFHRPGPSYTIDTLKKYRREYPHLPIIHILGSDSFLQIEAWHLWQQFAKTCHFIVVARPEAAIDTIHLPWEEMHVVSDPQELLKYPYGLLYCHHLQPELAISSKKIRELIKNQQSPRFLLPDTVLEFIISERLYQ